MDRTPDEVSFASRHGLDQSVKRFAIILAPVLAGAIGTLIYVGHARTIWGFVFVIWFVVLDFCLTGAALFREPNPQIASRVAYCLVALAGGAFGALEPNRWGGAIPILTMLLAVLAALVLEQVVIMGRSIARFLSRI
jgi:hypothetical protein